MAHVLDGVYEEVVKLSLLSEGRHQEIARNFVSGDKLNAMDQKLQSIETTVQGYQQQFLGLQKLVRDSHSRLTVGLPQHMSESISRVFFVRYESPLTILQSYRQSLLAWDFFCLFSFLFSFFLQDPTWYIKGGERMHPRNICRSWRRWPDDVINPHCIMPFPADISIIHRVINPV
jgi:hypothetical protein